MCGIFAYLNFQTPQQRNEIIKKLLSGLKRLEYRGYDSAGIAIDNHVFKETGKVVNVESKIESELFSVTEDETLNTHLGIAHTRWATHGKPCPENSHPHHSNSDHEFLVVHNGIITNYSALKVFLKKEDKEGKFSTFDSETDTEVVAKLIQYFYEKSLREGREASFEVLVAETVSLLEGAYALIFKSKHFPGQAVATRKGSPLLVGVKKDETVESRPELKKKQNSVKVRDMDARRSSDQTLGSPVEYYFASDMSAVIEYTKRIIFLEDNDIFVVDKHGEMHIYNKLGLGAEREVEHIEMELGAIMKGGYEYFMEKEIMEQPTSVVNTMRGRINFEDKTVKLGGLMSNIRDIKRCRRIIIIACGTSYHSGLATRQIIEELTELPVMVELASDFLDRECPVFRDDVAIFISQSGETADTLMALRYCKKNGALVLGITNVVGSTICRETDCGVHVNAGPEIGVASTKAYTSQFISLLMFALVMSEDSIKKQARRHEIIENLEILPNLIQKILDGKKHIQEICESKSTHLTTKPSILVMGRGYNDATCKEGALKIKELTYRHSEGIQSGELKHGPLAMVDENMPIIMVIAQDNVHQKSLNALEQIMARYGKPIVICQDNDEAFLENEKYKACQYRIEIPYAADCVTGILTVVPLQLMSFYIARALGQNVDQPRNLAKSVTVE